MFRSTAIVAAMSAVASVSSAQVDTCTPGVNVHCSLQGTFLVHAVDEKRLLIAVDSHGKGAIGDGRLDHLFLFVSAKISRDSPRAMTPGLKQGTLSVYSDAKRLELRSEAGEVHFLSLGNVNWAHYSGYDVTGPKIVDLTQARQDETCDHVAASCWQVNGFRIYFPS